MRKYMNQIAAGLALALSIVALAVASHSGVTSPPPRRFGATYGNPALSSVSVSSPLTGNGTSVSPLSIPAATGSVPGYLASADWTTFNGKLGSVTADSPLSGSGTSGSHLVIAAATTNAAGSMSAADKTTMSQLPSYANFGSGTAVGMYMSPKIDFTQVADTTISAIPSTAGTIIVTSQTTTAKFIFTTTGATGGPTVSVGNNGTFNNIMSSYAVVLTGAGTAPAFTNLSGVSAATFVDLSTPIKVHVTGGATGGALQGYVVLWGSVITTPS